MGLYSERMGDGLQRRYKATATRVGPMVHWKATVTWAHARATRHITGSFRTESEGGDLRAEVEREVRRSFEEMGNDESPWGDPPQHNRLP